MSNTVLPPDLPGFDPLERLVALLKFLVVDLLKIYPIIVVVGTFALLLILTLLALLFQDFSFAP